MLIAVSSPSCGGKGTLVRSVRECFPHVKLSTSYTTRTPREGEILGVDYHYVSNQKFSSMILMDEFAEYAEVFGNHYGTPLSAVEPALKGECDLIVEIDCQGAGKLRRRYEGLISIFILPPSYKELERRIRKRNRDKVEHDIQERLAMATHELKQAQFFDYWVLNDDLFAATADILRLFHGLLSPGVGDLSGFRDQVVLERVQSQFPAFV